MLKTVFQRKILQKIHKLLDDIKSYYADNLRAVVLFGSIARGDFRESSDIDVLIILNKSEQSMRKRIESFHKQLGHYFDDHYISPVIITSEEARRFNAFYLGVFESHIVLYDVDGIVELMKKTIEDKKRRREIVEKVDVVKYWRIADAEAEIS